MTARHSARASAALRRLAEADPAFAVLALWVAHRDGEPARAPDPEAAVWSDAAAIFYGPAFAALPPHEQVGLAAHHVLHVALRHAPRARALERRFGGGFDPEIFNVAADALVNESLLRAGYALPRPALRLSDLADGLRDKSEPPSDPLATYDVEGLYLRLVSGRGGGRRGGGGRHGTGDGSGEVSEAGLPAWAREAAETTAYHRDLDHRDAQPASTNEAGSDAVEWCARLARAFETGRRAGHGIGRLGHLIADLPAPRTPWEVHLRRLAARALAPKPRPAPLRPTRRWIAADAEAVRSGRPTPGFEAGVSPLSPRPRIAVALDCSGSVDDLRLELFASQISGIARRAGAELHVLAFDTEVQNRIRLEGSGQEAAIRRFAVARGGGTDFRPVLAEAAGLAPSLIVVLTDLDGPTGDVPPGPPVLWAVPAAPDSAPRFGKVITLAQ